MICPVCHLFVRLFVNACSNCNWYWPLMNEFCVYRIQPVPLLSMTRPRLPPPRLAVLMYAPTVAPVLNRLFTAVGWPALTLLAAVLLMFIAPLIYPLVVQSAALEAVAFSPLPDESNAVVPLVSSNFQ